MAPHVFLSLPLLHLTLCLTLFFLTFSLNQFLFIIIPNLIIMDYYHQGQPQGQSYYNGPPQGSNNGLPPGWIQEWDAPDNRWF